MNRARGGKSLVLGRDQKTELQVAPHVWPLHRCVPFHMAAWMLHWFPAASGSRSKVLAWPVWSHGIWSHLWVSGSALLWLPPPVLHSDFLVSQSIYSCSELYNCFSFAWTTLCDSIKLNNFSIIWLCDTLHLTYWSQFGFLQQKN